MTSPVSTYLAQNNIPHTEFVHEGSVASIAQAAAERGQEVDQVIRSLLFRLKEGHYIIVLVAGTKKVSWKAMRAYFNQNRLAMPSPEDVYKITGYQIGSVNPFNLPANIDIYIDESVTLQTEVSTGSGVRGTGIIITVDTLKTALSNPPIAKFTE